jgi:DNA polymerase III epsilon subunit-like protein
MTDRGTWRQATNLVATDLEGDGESGDAAAMLEFAAVPLVNGVPALASAFSTLINPQRPVARRPWMSPGITGRALELAPTLKQVAPKIASRLTGAYVIGHNIGEDWALLHRSCPGLKVAGLIDTLVLARDTRGRSGGAALTALLDEYHLTAWVDAAVSGGQPHRALWDAVGAALLLEELIRRRWRHDPPLAELLTAAAPAGWRPSPPSLFDRPEAAQPTETGGEAP